MRIIAQLSSFVIAIIIVTTAAGEPIKRDPGSATRVVASKSDIVDVANFLNEFSDRRRRTVHLANPQSVLFGAQIDFVNTAKGNLTFHRRDLVSIANIPLVVARGYDSSKDESSDFGTGGWFLTLAETISSSNGQTLQYRDEFGTVSDWVPATQNIRARNSQEHADKPIAYEQAITHPTEITAFTVGESGYATILFRGGVSKHFQRVGETYALIGMSNSYGNAITIEWNDGAVRSIESETGQKVIFDRDDVGRITTVLDENNRSVEYRYDEQDRLDEVVDLGGHVWTYEYSDNNLLAAIRNPLEQIELATFYDNKNRTNTVYIQGVATQFDYGDNGTTVTDANGRQTKFEHNHLGITTSLRNAIGVETEIVLDRANRPSQLLKNGDEIASLSYNRNGYLKQLVTSNGSSGRERTRYYYDSDHRLARIRGEENINLKYNDHGNVTTVRRGHSLSSYSYSNSGALSAVGTPHGRFEFSTNEIGQPTSVVADGGRATLLEYFPDGRLKGIRYSDGSVESHLYDDLGLRSGTDNERGQSTDYRYTPAGSLFQITEGDSQQESTLSYDVDDYQRIRELKRSDARSSTFSYGNSGELASIVSEDSRIDFYYDQLGRLTGADVGLERIRHTYGTSEPDIRQQVDNRTGLLTSDRVSESHTFSDSLRLVYTRLQGSEFRHIRFDNLLGQFVLSSSIGTVLPNTVIDGALERTKLLSVAASNDPQKLWFAAPSNPIFIPPEFGTINCNVCPPNDPQSMPISPGASIDAASISPNAMQLLACGGSSEPPAPPCTGGAAYAFHKPLHTRRNWDAILVTPTANGAKVAVDITAWAAVSTAQWDQMSAALIQNWQKNFHSCGKQYPVTVKISQTNLLAPVATQLTYDYDIAAPAPAGTAPDNCGQYTGGSIPSIVINGDTTSCPASTKYIAHEFGHFFGFADAYADTSGYPALHAQTQDIMTAGGATTAPMGAHGRIMAEEYETP